MNSRDESPTTLPFGHQLPKRETISKSFVLGESNAVESSLDLNQYLVAQPAATFFLRMGNNTLSSLAILKQDILIVDRSLTATNGKLVIVTVDNQLMVKRLYRENKRIELHSANPSCPPIVLKAEHELIVWGVVSGVIRKL